GLTEGGLTAVIVLVTCEGRRIGETVTYEQTLKAINEYYHSNGTRRAVVEAFGREHPVPVEGLDNMSPSYIAWLIDRGYPLASKIAKEIQYARGESKNW